MDIRVIFAVLHLSYVFSQEPVVKTEYGRIRGTVKEVNGKKYTAFLGVPYAAPPVGDLRFVPPQRHEGWDDVMNTQDYPHACPQDPLSAAEGIVAVMADFPKLNYTQDEDCLFLNIFVTGDLPSNPETLLPVFFVIHGGGNVVGSLHESAGQIFVTEGEPIVLVAVQYRLASLGYMTSGDEHLKGMNGLKDQSFALRWVRDNIQAFGGDPNKVTINGESAGGENVFNHMVSPMSKGLFQKAISQSPPSAWRYAKPRDMRRHFLEFAGSLNCDGSSEEILSCLRGKSWEEIMNAPVPQFFVTQRVIDGDFMPDSPDQLWKTGKFNDAELIFGITDDDGEILVRYFGGDSAADFFSNRDNDVEIFDLSILNLINFLVSDEEILDKETITQFGNPLTNYEVLRTLVKDRYYDTAKNPIERGRGILDMATHCYFLIYGYWIVNQIISNSGSARMYIFSHRTEALGPVADDALPSSAFHGSDLPYQFGYAMDPVYGLILTEDEQQLARSVMKAWTSFAAGDPVYLTMSGDVVEWPEYTEDNKNVLLFNTQMSQQSIFDAEEDLKPALDFWLAVQSVADIQESDDDSSKKNLLKDEF